MFLTIAGTLALLCLSVGFVAWAVSVESTIYRTSVAAQANSENISEVQKTQQIILTNQRQILNKIDSTELGLKSEKPDE